ncbi:MAG TPA: SCP2 sterol-binding domain-containing protein [Pirellulales bacterium]|nr:SCP2 sterol-binding domain-containing protein [Pirellulales bacterium]
MTKLEEHPTVQEFRRRTAATPSREPLDAAWLRQLCLDCGADDAGLVEIDRPAIRDQRADILRVFPHAKTLVSFVCLMNHEPVRSPSRSVSNLEFHNANDHSNDVARRLVAALQERGVRALNPSAGFPMEMDRFPGKIWVVAHKPVAVEAGLGRMGIHRNVIHPKFGNFIVLGTVLIDAEASSYDAPLDYNPCLECKLCVAACPVGAISPQGDFQFSSCMTHNYREFMSGFADWIERVAASNGALSYREKATLSETASMWQSLSFGPNYEAAYCLAVCPAGEDVIGPFLTDRATYLSDTLRPLADKPETIYVIPGSDAEDHATRRFPAKTVKRVSSGIRATSIDGFLFGLKLLFQPGKAAGLEAVYHFTFTGQPEKKATVAIHDGRLAIHDGHEGQATLRIVADSQWWLAFVAKERNLLWAILRRKIRLRGSLRALLAFARCFPS